MAQPLHYGEEPDPLCSYEEAARLLDVTSLRTVARYAQAGYIVRVTIGGRRKIVRESIYEYKARLAREATAEQKRRFRGQK